jgi:hypothetical protein
MLEVGLDFRVNFSLFEDNLEYLDNHKFILLFLIVLVLFKLIANDHD